MTGIIILAAGASTRLGRAKQTLQYQGKSLLKHAVDSALSSGIGSVIVVVGANENEIFSQIQNKPVFVINNKNWKEGMASSIHAGVTALLQHHSNAANLILMVCDQPFVDENILKNLLEVKRATNNSIVACSYNNTIGVPVLFGKKHFPELLSLQGEEGGKKVLLKHKKSIAFIPFPAGSIDIDTVEDYEALNK